MPGFDSTGPEGQGPMTGRNMGKCGNRNSDDQTTTARPRRRFLGFGGNNQAGSQMEQGRGLGRGLGRRSGRGMGRGRGNGNGMGRQ